MTGSAHRYPSAVEAAPLRRLLNVIVGVTSTVSGGAFAAAISSQRFTPWLGERTEALRFVLVSAVMGLAITLYRRTVRRRLWRERERFSLELENDLFRAKDQFIANVSHGLRTPLTGIVGFAHVLKESIPDDEDAKHVDFIIAESAELGRMVDDLLMSARLDAGAIHILPQEVWFGQQVELVNEFMALLGARLTVDYQDVQIRVDPESFRQVLRNLLVNAHRHGKSEVAIKGQIRGDRYICVVIDHGPGVPTEVQQRLFTRFAYRSGSGITGYMGLGLSVAGQLCKRMNCEISYRRTRGETHFVVSIPLAETNRQVGERPPLRVTKLPEPLITVGHRLDLPA